MEKPELPGSMRSRSYRWGTATVGLLFIALAIAILLTADSQHRTSAYGAAFVIGGLGIDAVVSAMGDRRSILSRIGPLP